jgi:hypothetical protein
MGLRRLEWCARTLCGGGSCACTLLLEFDVVVGLKLKFLAEMFEAVEVDGVVGYSKGFVSSRG